MAQSPSARVGGIRRFIQRRPFLTTGAASFVVGFALVAGYLLFGAVSRVDLPVPNVTGLLFNDAAARLKAAGFKVGTGQSTFHPTAPRNSVLAQEPLANVKAAKGSTVSLDVSLGPKKGTVPNVLGMSRADAETAIEQAGFDVGDVAEKLDARPRGEVIAVAPNVGQTVLQPSPVRVTISAGPNAIGVPALVGMPVEDALALVGQLGLVAGTVRADSNSTQPAGFVSAQRPGSGTPVTPGTTVTLTVSRPRPAGVPDSATPPPEPPR
jgi:eukaryotic-like serine/threonine-protein kinase